MDIRQDSSVHRRLVTEIVPLLRRPEEAPAAVIDPTSASDDERCAFVHELAPLSPLSDSIVDAHPEGTSRDTLRSLEAAAAIFRTLPE